MIGNKIAIPKSSLVNTEHFETTNILFLGCNKDYAARHITHRPTQICDLGQFLGRSPGEAD